MISVLNKNVLLKLYRIVQLYITVKITSIVNYMDNMNAFIQRKLLQYRYPKMIHNVKQLNMLLLQE